MSKEGLLISLLKLEQSVAKLRKSKSNNIGIEEIKRKFNMLRNNFSKKKIKEIRKKIYKKEKINKYLNKTRRTRNKTRKTREKILHQGITRG